MATAVSNIGNGADITSLSNNIVAAAFTSLNATLDAAPPSAAGIATTTAATAAALLSAIGAGVAGVTGGADAVAAAATTIINQIAAANSSSLTTTLLAACAAVSATKTNSSDANAIANGTALVTAFLNAYASQTVELTDSNDINALLANVSHSSTPSSVTLVVPDNNYIPLGDTAKSYYMPLVPGTPYRVVNSRGQEFNIVYSAQNNTISVGQFNPPAGAPSPTVYAVGDSVYLGYDKYTLFAVGTGGFTAGDQTKVVSATAARSGTSVSVSWVLPNLNFTITSVDVIPTVNGTARASQRVSSGNSYTLSNLNSGDVVSFSVSMYDGELSSASLTSNTITVPTNNTVPCFPTGTRIATASGYKTVESLVQNELVLTSDGRQVPVKIYGKRIAVTDSRTAPYVVPKGSLGHNSPSATLTLSPDHAFLVRKGVWMLPIRAAQLSSKVKQIGVGEPVAYYHLECPNYLQDNLVVDGVVVESYAANQLGCKSPYTYSESLKGYTRSSMAVTSKSFSKA
jgi:hypothetical protein